MWKRDDCVIGCGGKRWEMAAVERGEGELSEVQAVVNPITSKLYAGGNQYAAGEDDEQEPFHSHDEL